MKHLLSKLRIVLTAALLGVAITSCNKDPLVFINKMLMLKIKF